MRFEINLFCDSVFSSAWFIKRKRDWHCSMIASLFLFCSIKEIIKRYRYGWNIGDVISLERSEWDLLRICLRSNIIFEFSEKIAWLSSSSTRLFERELICGIMIEFTSENVKPERLLGGFNKVLLLKPRFSDEMFWSVRILLEIVSAACENDWSFSKHSHTWNTSKEGGDMSGCGSRTLWVEDTLGRGHSGTETARNFWIHLYIVLRKSFSGELNEETPLSVMTETEFYTIMPTTFFWI